jgi:hypothetical protein
MAYRRVSTIEAALRQALNEHDMAKRDAATVELAMRYARAIDNDPSAIVLSKVGPPLLAALEALYMSPRVRAAVTKGAKDGPPAAATPTAKLDELAGRRARKGPTADLDTGPT